MRRERGALFIISLFIAACFLLEVPEACVANIATWTDVHADGAFHNGTFLMMPEASVQINITRDEYGCSALIMCLFTIQTNVTQNSTLAFVFPREEDINRPEDRIWSDMHINLNGTNVNYTILDWEELGWDLDNNTSEYHQDWYTDSSYAVFDTTITANTSIQLEVYAHGEMSLSSNYCELEYIVGSARTFIGDTHEKIIINVVEHVPFLNKDFYPESHLVVYTDGNVTTAAWEFQISEFESDSVMAVFDIEYLAPPPLPSPSTSTTGVPSDYPNYIPLGAIAVSLIGVIAIIVIWRLKR